MTTRNAFYATGHGGGPRLHDREGRHDRLHATRVLDSVAHQGYEIQNWQDTLGTDLSNVDHNHNIADNWALVNVVEVRKSPVRVYLGANNTQEFYSWGVVKARFITPLADALYKLERYFIQSSSVMEALVDLRVRQYETFTDIANMLLNLGKHINPRVEDTQGGGEIPSDMEMRNTIDRLANDILNYQNHESHGKIRSSLALWTKCKEVLTAEQSGDVAAGELKALDWKSALFQAQHSIGIHHIGVNS